MRVFDHPNLTNFICPICNASEDAPVVLVGIEGTQDDNIIEATQVHLDCIDLRLVTFDSRAFLVQRVK